MAGIIQQAGSDGIDLDRLRNTLQNELTLDNETARNLADNNLQLLLADKLCKSHDAHEDKIVWCGNGEHSFDQAIGRLIDGAINRYCIREGGSDTPEVRLCLAEFFKLIILQRGWDLGAAFASHAVPESVDVDSIMKGIALFDKPSNKKCRSGLASAVSSLFAKPDDEEANLLAQLGRLAFGLELALEAPHDAVFYAATLPERIYLDANVLMPSITAGHPQHEVFNAAIKSLLTAAAGATFDVGVYVYAGFLNEVVSHRKLAIEEMGNGSAERLEELERSARFLGSPNVNVYIGAFFNMRLRQPALTFNGFLSTYAPYNTEKELADFLRRKKFRIVSESQLIGKDTELPRILGALDVAYADQLAHRRKSAVVVRHDAVQMAGLDADIKAGHRAIFVTADRSLRLAFESNSLSRLNNAMISHIGLIQMVDLLVGGESEPRGLTSLLWATQVSSETARVRDYLVDMALQERDVGLARAMHDVVDDVAENVAFELERKNISLTSKSPEIQNQALKTLERYEKDFFEKMRLVIEESGDNA